MKSKYDELHDRYHQILTTKKGTRYEILAAVVFAALERNSVVIHDLRIVGSDSGVEHQIDVHIERDGVPKRVLIECKDFDISGDPVGLGILRDFWGVVDDIHPDEAWVVTCNGFTKDARRYAKAKGIRLATLRQFADADWENRVRTIVVKLVMIHIDPERPVFTFKMSDADLASLGVDFTQAYPRGGFAPNDDRTQLFDGKTTRALGDICRALAGLGAANGATEIVEAKECEGWISADGGTRYDLQGYRVSIPVSYTGSEIRIDAVEGAAQLLLSDNAGVDFVVFDTTLEAYEIDGKGAIHLAPDSVQNRVRTSMAPLSITREILATLNASTADPPTSE